MTSIDPGSGLDPYRLPGHVRPSRYDVRLRPSLSEATFTGSVTIAVDVASDTELVVLNAAELTVSSCTVDGEDAAWTLDAESERMFVAPASPLAPGSSTIEIEFAGILNDKLRGFYRSTYTDDDGVEQVVATTQMQATDCRRAFPCWDEPEYKAVFGITLDVDQDLTAVSNGPEVSRTVEDGRAVVTFADTMVMSSYLVAFVVGRLEITDPVDVDGIPLRIVHVPGKGHLTAFGLDVGAFSLRWFQDYYGIAYPSDKVDMVALPDFAAGAMENLGCITFRESVLLVDPETSTQDEQERVADVVAHELAHMWFGDLVTMRWWNGIWLNEAFATFMEIAACDAYRPDWERWTSFGLERSAAFEVDSLASTRPVEFEVRSPTEAEGMFDVLTYQKGGALLRMLEQYLSPEEFRRGVNHYLETHRHSNTETNDLWDAIESTSGRPVRTMMDSWIWQPGYPLVSAALDSGSDDPAVVLTQERFSFAVGLDADHDTDHSGVDDAGPSGDDTVWVVPVHVRNGGETSVVVLDDAGPLRIPLADPDGPVVVNAGGHGFFRVRHDEALRERLSGEALAGLDTLERYSLVDDAWAAALAGRLTSVQMLELVEGFSDERDLAVWQSLAAVLRNLGRLLDADPDADPDAHPDTDTSTGGGTGALDVFRSRVRDLVGPALESLGEPSDDEPDLTSKLRGLLTSTMGALGQDEATIERCRELFASASDDDSTIDPELLAAATSVVAATGGEAEHDRMVAGFENGATPQEQLRHLYALAGFDDAELIRRTCEYAMSGAVKTQNAPFLLRLAIANRDHGALAWEYVRDRWDDANERFPSNTIVRMIDSVKLLTDPEVVDDVQTFFSDHPIRQALQTQEQVLERQRVNAAFHARESDRLERHLTTSS